MYKSTSQEEKKTGLSSKGRADGERLNGQAVGRFQPILQQCRV